MVQAILVLQQIEQNTKGNNNSGILKSNRSMGHSIITASMKIDGPDLSLEGFNAIQWSVF